MELALLDVNLIIHDDKEGWQLEDFWDYKEHTEEIWFYPAAHYYLKVKSKDGTPLEWYEVKPTNTDYTTWEKVEYNEASTD